LGHAEQSIIKIGSLLRSFINKRLDSFHHIGVLSLQKLKKNCETPQFLQPINWWVSLRVVL
jgi:hypothetical protein